MPYLTKIAKIPWGGSVSIPTDQKYYFFCTLTWEHIRTWTRRSSFIGPRRSNKKFRTVRFIEFVITPVFGSIVSSVSTRTVKVRRTRVLMVVSGIVSLTLLMDAGDCVSYQFWCNDRISSNHNTRWFRPTLVPCAEGMEWVQKFFFT